MPTELRWTLLLSGLLLAPAHADEPPEPQDPDSSTAAVPPEQGAQAFRDVARVLQSPRCLNCHPAGDVPLQGDDSRPHTMQITRDSAQVGQPCSTCHRPQAYDAPHLPPGNPVWHLAPRSQVFQGLTPAQLCASLKDPERNGARDLHALLEHVSEDPLVLWGWSPGGERTTPPLDHDAFVQAFTTWVDSGGACP